MYFQIANVVQARIFAGSLPPGALIGTEHQLAVDFGVSRITIRKALDVLRGDGLLKVERGRGTFVADHPRPVAPTALHVFLDDILARGETLEVLQDEPIELAAPTDVARALRLRPGAKVVRIRRHLLATESHGQQGDVWVTYFVTRTTWRRLDPNGRRGPLLREIDRTPGLRLVRGREVIQAVAADAEMAAWLMVAPGSAILQLERDYQTADGRTVVFGWVHRVTGGIPVLLSRTPR